MKRKLIGPSVWRGSNMSRFAAALNPNLQLTTLLGSNISNLDLRRHPYSHLTLLFVFYLGRFLSTYGGVFSASCSSGLGLSKSTQSPPGLVSLASLDDSSTPLNSRTYSSIPSSSSFYFSRRPSRSPFDVSLNVFRHTFTECLAMESQESLKPFRIRNLLALSDTQVADRAGSRHGVVRVSAPEYDETISNQPDATLMYLDEDDGEVITVRLNWEPHRCDGSAYGHQGRVFFRTRSASRRTHGSETSKTLEPSSAFHLSL